MGTIPLMGHAWYLSAQMFFYLCYNKMQDIMERKRWNRLCSCFDREGGCLFKCGSREGDKIATISELVGRLCLTYFLCLPMFFLQKMGFHLFGPLRIPQFYLGMLVGQACLHVELDQQKAKCLSIWCDVIAASFLVLMFYPVGPGYLYMYSDVPLAFLIFALCRGPSSVAAKILGSTRGFGALAPYSFAIYLFHLPVIQWMNMVYRFKWTGLSDIWNFDYAAPTNCPVNLYTPGLRELISDEDMCKAGYYAKTCRPAIPVQPPGGCYLPTFGYIYVFAVTICLAVLHKPDP